jgi:hypothetical protein
MKKLKCGIATLSILQVALLGIAVAQSHSRKSSASSFLVDSTKPYVYLKVDHIGPRRPIREGEPNVGIWLRWHNNCTVPITVYTSGVENPTEDDEVGVYYSVVANPPPTGNMSVGTPGYPTPAEMAAELWGTSPPKTSPTAKLVPARTDKPEDSKMPGGDWLDVGSLTTIFPGQSIYFSLPRNSVSPKWQVEIPFEFDLKVSSPNTHTYVTLYEDDLHVAAGPGKQ